HPPRRESLRGTLLIGGAVTFGRLVGCDIIREAAPLLYEAASSMGTPAIRRLATLAGNVAAAIGNADGAVALVALDAEAEVTNLTGAQWLPVSSLFVRPGVSRVNPSSEIVTTFSIPTLDEGQGYALVRAKPAMPWQRAPFVLGLVLTLDAPKEKVARASVAVGWAGDIPTRLEAVEKAMVGLAIASEESAGAFGAMVRDALVGRKAEISPALEMDIARLAPRAFQRAAERALQGSGVARS
ncbi:MAG: FAD binding domain-containing protein, partial [Chloroflexi bacterium]|nr:FAD binding domain-containing protein [Chloroflexota bacterium]